MFQIADRVAHPIAGVGHVRGVFHERGGERELLVIWEATGSSTWHRDRDLSPEGTTFPMVERFSSYCVCGQRLPDKLTLCKRCELRPGGRL